MVTLPKNDGLTTIQVRRIQQAIASFNKDPDNRDRELAFDILSLVQDHLNDFASGQDTSLEEERQKRLEEEARKKKEEDEKIKRKQMEKELEQREIRNRLLQDEIKRRQHESELREATENSLITQRPTSSLTSIDDSTVVKFDRTITVRANGNTYKFDQVHGKIPTKVAFFGNHYLVKPVTDLSENENTPIFLLTEIDLDEPFWISVAGKNQISSLEKDLEIVRHISHPNVVSLYEFKIVHTKSDGWRIYLLSEFSPTSYFPLVSILDTVESVSLKVAKNWASQILDGLECIHKHGISHKLLNLYNVCLVRNADTKDSIVKLDRVCFGYLLTKMNSGHPFNATSATMSQRTWEPPELDRPNMDPTAKSDVYDFGTILCQLLAGIGIVKDFRSPKDYLTSSQAFPAFQDTEIFDTLTDFLGHTFNPSTKKRYSVLELLTSKFIRDHDSDAVVATLLSPVTVDRSMAIRRRSTNSQAHRMASTGRSATFSRIALSRYETDFSEVQILGKGAYGEVVKARHRLEGQFYAIKKIKSATSKVDKLLGEIQLLSRLNHPNIVRYFAAWLEEDAPILAENAISDSEGDDSEIESSSVGISTSKPQLSMLSQSQSFLKTGSFLEQSYSTPLDGRGGPDIVFEYSSDSESETGSTESEETSDDDESESSSSEGDISNDAIEDESNDIGFSFGYDSTSQKLSTSASVSKIKKLRPHSIGSISTHSNFSPARPSSSRHKQNRAKKKHAFCTIYIQMEYCENHTLADLIKEGLFNQQDEYWRLFRQIIDALEYMHMNGIIHRDLKPVNIFIDQGKNVKIGDFGLAKSVGQTISTTAPVADSTEELTQEVGTGLYIAPEVLSSNGGTYGSKVDMYSLGIIFFEMVFPLTTAMERVTILRGIRNVNMRFPKEFLVPKYSREYQLVSLLLDHDSGRRPSAKDLQDSPLVPTPHEDEILEKTLQKIVNVRGDSRLVFQVCNVIFSKELDTISSVLYDRGHINERRETSDYLLMTHILNIVSEIFQHHGAVPIDDRPTIFPKPSIYEYSNIAEFVDNFGTILQLPYDLTYPFARKLAQEPTKARKSYTFGNVYRQRDDTPDKSTEPRKRIEIAFDIVNNIKDPSYYEDIDDSETIKVLDEVISSLPSLNKESISIVLNHSDILDSILKFCSVPQSHHSSALMLLGQYGLGPASLGAKAKFLDQQSMSSSTLTDLEQFGVRMELGEAEKIILRLMRDSKPGERFHKAMSYLKRIEHSLRVMGVKKRIYLVPLSHYNSDFYKSGIMFQIIHQEKRKNSPLLLAAGGRYNHLISLLRTQLGSESEEFVAGAVGFNLSLDRLYDSMVSYRESRLRRKSKQEEKSKRGLSFEQLYWLEPRCDVLVCTSKEGGNRDNCMEVLNLLWSNSIKADYIPHARQSEQLAVAEAENVNFILSIRQPSASASKNFRPFRIVTVSPRDNTDVTHEEVVPKLVTLLRERCAKSSLATDGPGFGFSSLPTSYLNTSLKTLGNNNSTSSAGSGGKLDQPNSGYTNGSGAAVHGSKKKVKILSEGKVKGGKKNIWKIEQEALESINKFKDELNNSEAYYSLDVKDDVLDAILTTSLTSLEDWKRKVVPLSLSQKAYLLETQAKLANEKTRGTNHIYLYSTKTGRTVVYSIVD